MKNFKKLICRVKGHDFREVLDFFINRLEPGESKIITKQDLSRKLVCERCNYEEPVKKVGGYEKLG